MQINNNRITDFYPPVPLDNRNQSRLPVSYEAVQNTPTRVSEQRADKTTVVLSASQSDDGQQARFIRNFISSDRQFDADNQTALELPRAVQQYLFIEQLPNQNQNQQGQFLDELV